MGRISKLKAVDPKTTEPSKPKVLIYGKPGAGKTWGALDFPSVYYIDTEGGAKLSHYTDKLKKSGGMYMGPDEGSMDFLTVVEQFQALATEQHQYKTVVIDSISKLFNIEITKKESEKSYDAKSDFGAAKKPAVNLTRRLISWIDRMDMNVILIAHERPEWFKGEQIGTTFDAYEKLEYELDLALNIVKQGESRKALVRKSRLLGFPEGSNFAWSYNDFAERYGKDVIERKVTQVILATEEQLAELAKLLEVVKLADGEQEKWFTKANVTSFAEMSSDVMGKIIDNIKGRIK